MELLGMICVLHEIVPFQKKSKGLVQTGLAISFPAISMPALLQGQDLPSRNSVILGQVLSILITEAKLV